MTLQGTLLKRSHMTGGLSIQSPYNDQSGKTCTTSLEIVEIGRNICMHIYFIVRAKVNQELNKIITQYLMD